MTKKILVISPIPSHPRNAGHRERIYQLVQIMQQFGHDVHFLYITQEKGGDLEAMKSCWGEKLHLFAHDITRTPNHCSPSFHGTFAGRFIRRCLCKVGRAYNFPYAVDDWYDAAIDEYLRGLQQQIGCEIVMVEYLFFSKALEQFDTDVLKILDTHDVFTNRQQVYRQHPQMPAWFYTTRSQEKRGVQRADVILAIQDHERRFFASLVPEKQVVTVGHFVELCRLPFRNQQPQAVLFFASSNPVNVHGLTFFLEKVWPTVSRRLPRVQLLIGGSVCQAIAERPDYTSIGMVAHAKTVYEQADVVISPILFGTGLKIKNVEAMAYAKPLITTHAGAAGLEHGNGQAFFVAATADEFADNLQELLTNTALRQKMGEQAYQFASAVQQQNITKLRQILQREKTV